MNALRFLPPIAVLAGGWLLMQWLIASRPEPKKRPPQKAVVHVETKKLSATDHQVKIRTRGTVRARTSSTLVPQVSGEIVEIDPDFREGGFFEGEEVLLKIDDSDYANALTVAAGALAEAESALAQEQARAEQAKANWERLGGGKPATPLVLRTPQLAEATARVAAAKASLSRAERDLERTSIRAPYAGRVLEKSVDVGQFVTAGTALAQVYAIDFAEIRLPLTNRQLTHLKLPESFRDDGRAEADLERPRVRLSADYGGRTASWDGEVVRAEGAIDTASRQLFVVAQVRDPYARREGAETPLKVGMFVEAEISGDLLENVFVIPRAALRGDAEVMLVDAEGKLERREVEVAWVDGPQAIISAGLKEGEVLCLTPVPFAPEGTKVVSDGMPAEPKRGGRP